MERRREDSVRREGEGGDGRENGKEKIINCLESFVYLSFFSSSFSVPFNTTLSQF